MKFFDDVGKLGMGTRVRYLGERIGDESAEIYRAYGNPIQPKWFPVFYLLSNSVASTGTAIADEIGHSHASVSKIIAEMAKAGVVTESIDPKDRRRTQVSLSRKVKEIARTIEDQYADVKAAIDEISNEATHNLWAAIEEWEYLLSKRSLYDRVLTHKKAREAKSVRIEPFAPQYREAFRRLNEEWISTYFKLEKPDIDALSHPESYIIDKGGFIFVATIEKEPVGVCALIRRDDLDGYELAKMAVSPQVQGRSIGYLLGQAVIEKARNLQAKRLYLESNTVLKPAIRLYEKLGFKKIVGPKTPYERCNIQMAIDLD